MSKQTAPKNNKNIENSAIRANRATNAANVKSAQQARFHVKHPYVVLMGLYMGGFTGMYSETALNIALPDLSKAFGVATSLTQWLVIGYMLVIMFAPAIGPTLAGGSMVGLGWCFIFLSFAVFLVIGLVFAACFMVNPYELTRPHIDALSVVLSVLGFGGIVLGVSLILRRPRLSASILTIRWLIFARFSSIIT